MYVIDTLCDSETKSPVSSGAMTKGDEGSSQRRKVFCGLNVLVVDDAVMVRKLLGRILTAMGCVCEMAEDGLMSVKAVEKRLREHQSPYDVILMDFVMPV